MTAVDGSTITVASTGTDGAESASEIAVDETTAFTRTVTADASAVAVGRCLEADGEFDERGGLAATTVTVSDPADDGCVVATAAFPSGGFAGGAGEGTDEGVQP